MTDAPTLAAFLLARIAEDEADAPRIHDYDCPHLAGIQFYGPDEPEAERGCGRPARVLAECAAKRRIVELHKIEVAAFRAYGGEEGVTFVEPDSFEDITTRRWMCSTCHNIGDDGPCSTLRLLALPYANHPDYDDSWRP